MRLLGLVIVVSLVAASAPADAGVYITWHRKANPGPSAREQAARNARQQVNAAQANFTRAYAEAVRNHPLNEELRQARAELARARIELDQVTRQVRGRVADRSEVDAYRRDVSRLQRRLDGARSMSDRLPIAQELMQARSRLSRLEAEALSDDVYVTLARAGVQNASNEVTALEERYQTLLRADPGFSAAKLALDNARYNLIHVNR